MSCIWGGKRQRILRAEYEAEASILIITAALRKKYPARFKCLNQSQLFLATHLPRDTVSLIFLLSSGSRISVESFLRGEGDICEAGVA